MLLQCIGRDKEEVRKDTSRNKYFTPAEAIEYGLIDHIYKPLDAGRMSEKKLYGQKSAQAAAQQRERVPAGAGASAEGGY